MKQKVCAFLVGMVLLMACNKKEPQQGVGIASAEGAAMESLCGKEFITDKPVKVGETGITLPVGTTICLTPGNKEVKVELPGGYVFLASNEEAKAAPVFGTYSCICSVLGSACTIFYIDGLGFGCLQGNCGGSCTGRFTYKGYSIDQIAPTGSRTEFFNLEEVQKEMEKVCSPVPASESYRKLAAYGVSFYLVNDEILFKAKANCDCEGTAACTLKTLSVSGYQIYYCDGPCNGCELTVN